MRRGRCRVRAPTGWARVVTGIEPWPTRFKDAEQIAESLGADIDLRNVYLGELNEPDGAYDVVMALNVIHHQPDPFAFLDQASA